MGHGVWLVTVAVVGEALIDLIVGEDGAYRPHLGGSPYNVAIGLARQGLDVSYLSSLSDDRFGDMLYDSLLGNRVRVPLERRSFWPTSIALVTVDEKGQPRYRLYREGIADKDTSLEEIVENLPEGLRVFHTGSLAITPSQVPKIQKVFGLMHEMGVTVSVDINIRLRASADRDKYLAGVRSLLGDADIVKASDEDLAAFELGPDVEESAEIIWDDVGSGVLVVTQGTSGTLLYCEQGKIRKPAYPVATVVDAVGAGDTFHSAFLASLYRSGELSQSIAETGIDTLGDALDFACAAAAISVSRAGCSPPTEAEVADFIAATMR